MIFICSVLIMLLFAFLQMFIINGITSKDSVNSAAYYATAHEQAAEAVRSYFQRCAGADAYECLK